MRVAAKEILSTTRLLYGGSEERSTFTRRMVELAEGCGGCGGEGGKRVLGGAGWGVLVGRTSYKTPQACSER